MTKEEIMEATRKYLFRSGVKAAVAVNSVLDDPTALGNRGN